MQAILFWSLFGLTLMVYAAMLGWSLPAVSSAAGGLAPFDMRPSGYSFADAAAFLEALTPDGASFYRNVQQSLDIFYPALLGLTLWGAIVALLPRRFGKWRWLSGFLALPVALFDYLENHAVAAMIEAGAAGLTVEMVAEASQWTVLKSGATTMAMSALLLLLLVKGAALLLRLVPRLKASVFARS